MKFFKPEDFGNLYLDEVQRNAACSYANTKLEIEGKVVFRGIKKGDWWAHDGDQHLGTRIFERALIICIEPIEKCKHPKEKIKNHPFISGENKLSEILYAYICECGAKVQPKEFEEVR